MHSVLVRQGDKYGPQYTKALKKQLLEFTDTTPIILGDGPDADIPLSHNLKGWWAKMELFSPEMEKYRPLFYVDLDSLILKRININEPKRLTVCREWMSNDPYDDRIQSSVMIIPKDTDYIWSSFMKDQDVVTQNKGGDQWYLKRFSHDFLPQGLVGSYKIHGVLGPTHPIMTFHGEPKMKDVPWAEEIWKTYTA